MKLLVTFVELELVGLIVFVAADCSVRLCKPCKSKIAEGESDCSDTEDVDE